MSRDYLTALAETARRLEAATRARQPAPCRKRITTLTMASEALLGDDDTTDVVVRLELPINLALLADQKWLLTKLAEHYPGVEGILNLLDHIQDEVASQTSLPDEAIYGPEVEPTAEEETYRRIQPTPRNNDAPAD